MICHIHYYMYKLWILETGFPSCFGIVFPLFATLPTFWNGNVSHGVLQVCRMLFPFDFYRGLQLRLHESPKRILTLNLCLS